MYISSLIISKKKPKGKDGKPQCHLMTSWGYVMGAPLMATKGSMKRCLWDPQKMVISIGSRDTTGDIDGGWWIGRNSIYLIQ